MKTKTALCLTLLLMLLCAANMAMMWQLTHIKAKRTVEMTATVRMIDHKEGLIYVDPDGILVLPYLIKGALTQSVLEPLVGQQVHFRMKESAAQFYRQEQQGEILSLSTSQQDIFTLDDYNRVMQEDNAQGWPVWGMIEGGLLALALYFIWKMKKERGETAQGT